MTYINYRLDLAYKGTNYFGWQYQPDRLTVQGVLADTISELLGERVRVSGASRTDAKVHAIHQVASFKTPSRWEPDILLRALNSRLPDDVVIWHAKRAHPKFTPRYGVSYKVYEYLIVRSSYPDPFLKDLAWPITERLDIDSIRAAAEILSGTHDFSTFHKPDKDTASKGKRIGLEIEIKEKGPFIKLRFKAKYFLRYMVRKLVGAMVEVGCKRLFLEDLQFILEAKNPSLGKWIAPPHGLYLKRIVYDEEVDGGKSPSPPPFFPILELI